jgi:hypothetical protein
VAVITFEANGTDKHFFLFNVLADLLCLFATLDVVAVARHVWRTRALSSREATR